MIAHHPRKKYMYGHFKNGKIICLYSNYPMFSGAKNNYFGE